ncbi:armadillo-type protein [Armillaria nabsnona]|nr:armadillo-type protein [Armillaria nabsnona]
MPIFYSSLSLTHPYVASWQSDIRLDQRTFWKGLRMNQISPPTLYILPALYWKSSEVAVRLAAGYQLKHNVDLVYLFYLSRRYSIYSKNYSRYCWQEPVMRPVAMQIITALFQESGLLARRDWMRRLVSMLDDSNPELQEAILMVLYALYISNPNSLDATVDNQWSPQLLMHKYAVLTGHSSLNVRCVSLGIVPNIFRILSCVAVDCSPDVRHNTCQVLTKLFTHFPRDLMPGSVGEVMVQSLKDDDEGVALAACNFWYMLVKLPRYTAYTRPFLLSIIHALLDRMTYRESTSDASAIGVQSPLRVVVGYQVSDMLLVPLRTKMYQHNWLVRESAILAWGIVSIGCMSTIALHLQAITPYLLQACGDPQPLIRSTSCWTLGRYAQAFAQTNENRLFLAPIISRCLVLFFDTDERVQQGACTYITFEPEDPEFVELVKAIVVIIGAIGPLFLPYMGDMLRLCFDMIGVNVVPTGGENRRPLYVLHSALDVLFSIEIQLWLPPLLCIQYLSEIMSSLTIHFELGSVEEVDSPSKNAMWAVGHIMFHLGFESLEFSPVGTSNS